ncbi:MAG: hypothetical protein MJZ34_02915 [Paludibacteraceae bacterium]|nr:hypothetical protein [Paludibacteraceae bacterium]
MLKGNNFNLGVTAKTPNGTDIDIFDLHVFSELYVREAACTAPYYELYITGGVLSDAYQYTDFTLSYESDALKYKVPLGIVERVLTDNYLLVKGWMVKTEDIRIPQTKYLGKDAKEALTNLNIRDKIECDDNFTGNVFQINTTNMQQALSICHMTAKNAFWNIGRTSINLKEQTEESSFDIFASVSNEVYFSNENVLPKEVESPNQWISASWDRGSLDYHLKEQHDQHHTMLKNIKNERIGPKGILFVNYSEELTDIIGTKYPNNQKDRFPDVKQWILASVSYRYAMDYVSSSAQYYGVSDAIDQQKFVDGN